jgi:hypothetical protein
MYSQKGLLLAKNQQVGRRKKIGRLKIIILVWRGGLQGGNAEIQG